MAHGPPLHFCFGPTGEKVWAPLVETFTDCCIRQKQTPDSGSITDWQLPVGLMENPKLWKKNISCFSEKNLTLMTVNFIEHFIHVKCHVTRFT